MHLYNLYLRQRGDGVLIKVGDLAKIPMDKHRLDGDHAVGYISGRNRRDAIKAIEGIVGSAIANSGRILKQKPK